MRPSPHRPAREFRRALTALALTLSVFALPLWTVSVHEPNTELFTPAPSPDADRVASFVMTLPVEPEPTAQVEVEDEPPIETLPEPTEPEPSDLPEPVQLAQVSPSSLAPRDLLPPPPPIQSERTTRPKRKKRKKRNCQPDVPEIKPGKGREDYSVDRDLIDRYAKDLKAAARLAYVDWARDDNERIIGFQVVRIRCGSPLHEAGFQNGDIITRINGHKVRTVPQALAAYVALRVKRKLRVRGQRRDGEEMDLRYRLT